MNRLLIVLLFSLLLFLSTWPLSATTFYVDASVPESGDGRTWETAFKKVQEGMRAASNGDTVTVAPGVYVENIHFEGKNVTLTSTDPLDPDIVTTTIIDGNQSASVVRFSGPEDETCVLSGFTIRNGKAEYGGGICGPWDHPTRATIQNNVITGNSAEDGGGLAFCDGTIQDNVIAGNAATGKWISAGGGLYWCGGTIYNNVICDNWSECDGGGVKLCDGTIRYNTIVDNSAGLAGGGLSGCNGRIEVNLISGNSAREYGGGLVWCDGTIANNTITENSANTGGGLFYSGGTIENNLIARNSAGFGAGLKWCDGIQNNTICNNTARWEGGGLLECEGVIRNCIIWGNSATHAGDQIYMSATPTYSCIEGWGGGGKENISGDPRFVDATGGDYRLLADSACVDAGVNYHWLYWPQRDLGGNCRLVGTRVDMGCYEWGSSPDSDGDLLADSDELAAGSNFASSDSDGDGLRDGLEILRGSDPLLPTPPRTVRVPSERPTIQASLLLSVNGDEIVVSPGTYVENLRFVGPDVVIRSLDPTNPDIVASTILDGGHAGPVISFAGGESEACVLAGLTIQNGSAYCAGAGISVWRSEDWTRATIRNNTITHNAGGYDTGAIVFCDGTIESNVISGNSTTGLRYCHGTIQGNTVAHNQEGGMASCNGVIENNRISANHDCGLRSCSAIIRNNTIKGNLGNGLAFCGGTIERNWVFGNHGCGLSDCDGTIRNSTITGNSDVGLALCSGVIQGNTIFGNAGGGLSDCHAAIRNCIIGGNGRWDESQLLESSRPSYCCIEDWTGGGDGNIPEEPMFVDAENGNFRLLPASPCIDTGQNFFFGFFDTDIAGMHRIMYGGKRFTVDMGAYEYHINDLGLGPASDETTLTWSSLPYRTYSIFYCDDLLTWHLAEENLPSGEVETTSWIDDGSKTGLPPSLAPRRFYRVLENP